MGVRFPSSFTRIVILGLILIAGYALLLLSLWSVQIRKGEEHRDAISRQSIRRIRIPSIRGRILSSDGQVIADNRPAFNIILHLGEMRQPGRANKTIKFILEQIDRISRRIGRPMTYGENDIRTHMNFRPGLPFTVFENLSEAELAAISELREPVRGMEVEVKAERFYPDNNTFAHVLGYTGSEDPVRAEDKEEFFYYIPDLVGKQGVEREFDNIDDTPVELRGLKGKPGGSMVRVDHRGYIFEEIGTEEVANGNDIELTIDWRAQSILYRLMADKIGAGIVLDADSGAVIAMVSTPSFDPNAFSGGISSAEWNQLIKDKDKPMLNRACNGEYTPGSIVKPLVAMGLLENNIDASSIVCDGATQIGDAKIRCASWRRGGHGEVDLVRALAVSCNDYFIEKGLLLGLDPMCDFFRSAGLGRRAGFVLAERPGLVPTREDKRRIFGTRWNAYDTGLLSMGQGIIVITPLQAVVYTAAIANGGVLYKPYLLNRIMDAHGNLLYVNKAQETGRLPVSAAHLDIVRQGMYNVVNTSEGSGKRARNDVITLSGKSGTGEVGSRENRHKNTWFISYGTYKDKTYAMVVLVEYGDSGGGTCAPIVKDFFTQWLTGK
ncbi:MAG: penicillin-binding protein 2 [Victivallales bacterium]|nr:penicillin-binding protein 2 [Victivallales bacterium]